MDNPAQVIDISVITDLKTLKSMAYDQMAEKEKAERNLNNINARISQVMNMTPEEAKANLPKVRETDAPAESATEPTDAPAEAADKGEAQ